ncbi:hypothetical protein ZWY2020_047233 [Hordeum vulgare]|nr:hypothetical protein ZWY2020_047233 [Hordeum vulgare]
MTATTSPPPPPRLPRSPAHAFTPPPLLPLPLQAGLATTDTSCESVVTSGQQNVGVVPSPPPRDASPAGYVTCVQSLQLQLQEAMYVRLLIYSSNTSTPVVAVA